MVSPSQQEVVPHRPPLRASPSGLTRGLFTFWPCHRPGAPKCNTLGSSPRVTAGGRGMAAERNGPATAPTAVIAPTFALANLFSHLTIQKFSPNLSPVSAPRLSFSHPAPNPRGADEVSGGGNGGARVAWLPWVRPTAKSERLAYLVWAHAKSRCVQRQTPHITKIIRGECRCMPCLPNQTARVQTEAGFSAAWHTGQVPPAPKV